MRVRFVLSLLTIAAATTLSTAANVALNGATRPPDFFKRSPMYDAAIRSTHTTLSWDSAGLATYEYCIDTRPGVCFGIDGNWVPVGTATSVEVTGLLPNSLYFWQVRATHTGEPTYADAKAQRGPIWRFATPHHPIVELDGDGDRRLDAFAHDIATGRWQRSFTQSDGGFATVSGRWDSGWDVVPATFDRDRLTDFFLFNPSTDDWVKMLTTPAGFATQATGSWWPGWDRHVLDMNGDGISDIFLYDPITGLWFQAFSTPAGFSYFQGAWSPGWEIHPMRLNADRFEDLFLINRTTGRWFWAVGKTHLVQVPVGGFDYPATGYWLPTWNLSPGDFNGDGLTDLLLLDPPSGTWYVAMNNGLGTGFTYSGGHWVSGWTPYVADFDADGSDDLFLHNPDTGVWHELLSDGAGSFTAVGTGHWVLGWSIYPTDFNGDRRSDLLVHNPSTGVWYQARNLVNGAFTNTSGSWTPGLTVITRSTIR